MKKTTKKIIASALAATMVMASSAMVFADETTGSAVSTGDAAKPVYEELTPCKVSATKTVADGQVTVTISVDGDVSLFDFGIVYDANEVTYKSYKKDAAFGEAYDGANGIMAASNNAELNYVVIGGTSDELTYKGTALTVVFDAKVENPTISVIKDSKSVLDAYNSTGATGTFNDFLDTDPFDGKGPEEVEAVADTPVTTPDAPVESPAATTPATTDGSNNGGTTTTTTTAPATTTAAATTTKKSPKTGDAGVVLPIVAICGAAAAVAVASKKKVED